MNDDELLERIIEMDRDQLKEFIWEQCEERGIPFDPELLDGEDKIQAMFDFIADNLYPDLRDELHSKCKLRPGSSTFPDAKTPKELEDELEQLFSR